MHLGGLIFALGSKQLRWIFGTSSSKFARRPEIFLKKESCAIGKASLLRVSKVPTQKITSDEKARG